MANRSMDVCVNASRDSLSHAFVSDDSDRVWNIVLSLVFLLFLLVGLPLNLLVMVTIVRQRLYTQPTILLLLNLLIADLLELLLIIPFSIVSGLAGEFVFGNSDYVRCQVCTAVLFSAIVLYTSILFNITLLTLDRFLFIYKPLNYRNLVTARRVLVAIVIAWLLSVLLTIPQYTFSKNTFLSSLSVSCFWDSRLHDAVSITTQLIPYLLGLLFNVWVTFIAAKNIRIIYKVQKKSEGRRAVVDDFVKRMRSKKELHLVKVFGAIVISNTVFWIPFNIAAILSLAQILPEEKLSMTYTLSYTLFLSHVFIHPFLEVTFIKGVREPLKKMVKCAPCCKKEAHLHAVRSPYIETMTSPTEKTFSKTSQSSL